MQILAARCGTAGITWSAERPLERLERLPPEQHEADLLDRGLSGLAGPAPRVPPPPPPHPVAEPPGRDRREGDGPRAELVGPPERLDVARRELASGVRGAG